MALTVSILSTCGDGETNKEKVPMMIRLAFLAGMLCLLQSPSAQESNKDLALHVDPAYEHELQERLKQSPRDAEAFIALGLYNYDLQRYEQALPLFEKATELRRDARSYYFAGLTSGRVAEMLEEKAEKYVRKAIELNPRLADDLNIRAFLKRHPGPISDTGQETPALKDEVLDTWVARSNLFLAGIGVGLLLAAPVLYLAIRKRAV